MPINAATDAATLDNLEQLIGQPTHEENGNPARGHGFTGGSLSPPSTHLSFGDQILRSISFYHDFLKVKFNFSRRTFFLFQNRF